MKTGLRFLAFLLLAALIAASPLAVRDTARAQEPDPQIRTVSGIVLNATENGGAVSGVTVTLHRVSDAGFDNLTATTDGGGAFAFTNVEYDPNLAYGVSVRYDDALYGTDLDLTNGSADDVRLTVYDGTSDDGIVSTGAASLLLADADPSDQTMAALEILYLVNRSDKTYVPGDGVMELLRFGLPPGATGLTMDTRLIGADFVQVDRGFALMASVPPGEHEVMYSYRFPYESAEFTLEKTYRYGGESVRILAPEEVASISAPSLGEPTRTLIGERQYSVIEGGDLAREQRVSIRLGDLPTASAVQRVGGGLDGIRFEYAAPAALILLMIALLIYGAVWRTDARRETGRDAAPESASEPAATGD